VLVRDGPQGQIRRCRPASRTLLRPLAWITRKRSRLFIVELHFWTVCGRTITMADKAKFAGMQGPFGERDAGSSRWQRSNWTDMLTDSIVQRYAVSGAAFISPTGMFAVPHGNAAEEAQLANIGGASFVPNPQDDTKADLFAFVRPNREARVSQPKYMGTFALNDEYFRETENLLKRTGVGVSKLFIPK
jgi:hypothetical protein